MSPLIHGDLTDEAWKAATAGPTYTVYAFNGSEDPPATDQRRHGIPEWKLPEAVRWAVRRGFDTILIQLSNDAASSDRLMTHHVCSDAWCPGGCE